MPSLTFCPLKFQKSFFFFFPFPLVTLGLIARKLEW